jgi:site-specific DNA-cytosine methylase
MEHVQPQQLLADMCARVFGPDSFVSRNTDGQAVRVVRGVADLDLYVVGFMCTPFSDKGPRLGWAAPAAKTFINTVKTIQALRPRAVVLENVLGLVKTGGIKRVEAILRGLGGYSYALRQLNSCDYWLPQNRPRVYITLLREDAVNGPLRAVRARLDKNLDRMASCCKTPFADWLLARNVPIRPASAAKSTESAQSSGSTMCHSCGVNMVCPVHPCRCAQCKNHGENKKRCRWRERLRSFLAKPSVKRRRAEFLKRWRRVKKDKALKSPPSYFQLAALKKLTVHVRSPRECPAWLCSCGQAVGGSCFFAEVRVG